ncbi:NLR family CARD domain-containing protein 3-like isoform X1 [Astyanax mexicanus]|uniref:NLR family CARD domain-containing protein 3-like isoform X1 n=1 Tax=Astyanax mexicanus TaxID=7994 RepID=UPI0020CA9E44|nr:NLR family CARD domain-containing protein 3-like isoform X1 [Astyanax mexicanus]XP_049323202.1 NLR family CARD domain-containing protein 3-like isoform X1 [Astyanax mexicanus]
MEDSHTLQDEDASTGHREEPGSPVPSCASMRSNSSMNRPIIFQGKNPSIFRPAVHQNRPVPLPSSHVSIKSHQSMDPPITIKDKPLPSESRSVPSASSCVSLKSDKSIEPPISFPTNPKPSGQEMAELKLVGKTKSPNIVKTGGAVERSISLSTRDFLKLLLCEDESYKKYKSSLKDRFQRLSDQLPNSGQSTLLDDIYTDLYITEGDSGEVNTEHEVRQIEMAARTQQLMGDKSIKCNDIFKPLPEQDKLIRTVLTKGVAGIGKTVSVQKFIVDWAEGKANQEVRFIFPLPFRELNLINDQSFSLEGLVHRFIPQLEKMPFIDIAEHDIVFIFDGLDECRSVMDFKNDKIINDVTDRTTVDMLLSNLIKGNLLPKAKIWITSRPAASSQIPVEFVSQVTEIRGFNDPQKVEYFQKRIRDQSLAKKTIAHLKSSRSLYIMCHIPVFCWISATVLERMLRETEDAAIPKTLTQMYTHFLIIQTSIRKEKYSPSEDKEIDKEMILKLGHLAFRQLIKGNLIFYEEDLRDCAIDVEDAVVYSGVCTQIFREEFELHLRREKVFCFVHLSIQEHLAALYVYISFSEGEQTVLNLWNPTKIAAAFPCLSIYDLHQSAVDKALKSTNGQFDLFLRFLLGLSLENNLALLQVLLPRVAAGCTTSVEKTIDYIKIRLRMTLPPEKYINLFHCLNELNDSSLQDEIQTLLGSGRLSKTKLSPAQWSALVFVLLNSDRELSVFDLRKYSLSNADECLYRMLPVVEASKTAEVRQCNLSVKGFQSLASALSSKSSNLRELKLSGTKMHGSTIKNLSEGLKNLHCKLEILDLSECNIQTDDCRLLASALNSNPQHLKELDLSFNPIGDSAVLPLCGVLYNPKSPLKKLKLYSCELTQKSCAVLSEALATHSNSSLTELDLSKNALQDHGVKMLSDALKNPHFKLRSLSLTDCGITEVGCVSLYLAFHSNPSHLIELCLNYNRLRDSGVKVIADILKQPQCKLEKLSLSQCEITDEGCAALASALRLNPEPHLRELELTRNKPGTLGKNQLRALQEHPDFRLEKLKF